MGSDNVNFKSFRIIFIVLIIIMFTVATYFFTKGLLMEDPKTALDKPSSSTVLEVDLEKRIDEIAAKHEGLIYKSEEIPEFISLAFIDGEKLSTYYIDAKTGLELNFTDLIKPDKIEDFHKLEEELLRFKYPQFIVEGILKDEGEKVYWVKENEIIVYYYDYVYDYPIQEDIFLKLNNQEIKENLNYTYKLDLEYTNEDGYQYSKDKKTVAITFDDGPSSQYNEAFLSVLEQNKSHATFFMVGSMMRQCQKCVLKTYESGNEIGMHSYGHINITKSTLNEVLEDLKKTDDLFYQITNDHIKYFRPPYGSYNKENLENINYPFILWNLDTEDWRYKDAERTVNYVMENISDGDIILMHELYGTSLEALEILLPRLYAEGYQVVSVSELAQLKQKDLLAGYAYRSIKS